MAIDKLAFTFSHWCTYKDLNTSPDGQGSGTWSVAFANVYSINIPTMANFQWLNIKATGWQNLTIGSCETVY